MPRTVTYFELSGESDIHNVIIARFSSPNDAEAVCKDPRTHKKYGEWGSKLDPKHRIREVCFPLFDSVAEYWQYNVDDVKKKALAKLTDLEKKALGLPL
jgi:hypothetical protein